MGSFGVFNPIFGNLHSSDFREMRLVNLLFLATELKKFRQSVEGSQRV